MKTLFTFLVFVSPFALVAQSCCDHSSTGEFAALADNKSFRMGHDEPLELEFKPEGADFEFPIPGGDDGRGYIIRADKPTNNYIFVIHEWWGLNDYIRQTGEKLKKDLEDVSVICLDLYDGKLATRREDAATYMKEADEGRILDIIQGAKEYVGTNVRVATIGWCFGGGWSLQASIELADQAAGCVMYYGMPEKDLERLSTLKCDVLGIFASKDGWITGKIVSQFEKDMKDTGKQPDIAIFEAEHAFANPSNPNYDRYSAKEAYSITMEFLHAHFAE